MRAVAALLLSAWTFVAAADDETTRARGRKLSADFVEGKTAAVWAEMDPGMQRFVRSADALAKFQAGAALGAETALLSETIKAGEGVATYERVARFAHKDEPWVLRWELDSGGKVMGFSVQPNQPPREPAPSRHLDYVTRAQLRLPFDGEWTVFWGGRTVEQNQHAVQAQQRFAYDLMITRDGSSHRGDGKALEDYYCWDAPIRAPAAARVVSVVADQPDQPIGSMDKAHLAGNHIVLDLGNGEYAFLAHLRQGSVRVKAGDTVATGAELGRCGNSGNTSEPHLHFHLQDSPQFGAGEGLPAFFVDYIADGKPVTRGEPVKGQVVRAR